jgi:hypothetical protein
MRSVAALGSPASGAEELQPMGSVNADVRPEIRCSSLLYRPEHSGLRRRAPKRDGAAFHELECAGGGKAYLNVNSLM